MSRLFAKYLFDRNKVDVDTLSAVFDNVDMTGKYLKTVGGSGMFEFKVLDFYGYVSSGDLFFYFVKISENDLLRMIKIDTYTEEEKNVMYYHEQLGSGVGVSGMRGEGLEQENLDDNVFWDISVLQYFFHISRNVIVELKRQAHLSKLKRVNTKRVSLKRRVLHSNGGRPVGSLGAIEWQNIENADRIIENCVEKDWFVEYMDLCRELKRAGKLSEILGEGIESLTGAKWKFYQLRYEWKLARGYCVRDKEYEEKILLRLK